MAEAPSPPRKRRLIRHLAALLLGLAILAALLLQLSLDQLAATLAHAHWPLVVPAICCGLMATVFRTVRFRGVYGSGVVFWRMYGAFAFMRVLTTAFPFGTGEVAFLAMLKRAKLGGPIAELAPAWSLIRLSDIASLMVMVSLAAAVSPALGTTGWASIPVLAGILGAAMALWWIGRTLVNLRSLQTRAGWLRPYVLSLADGFRRIDSPRRAGLALATGLLVWSMLVLETSLAQIAFGTPLSVWATASASALMLAAGILPLHAPLAVGTGEAARAGILMLWGIPAEQAILIALGVRLVSLGTLLSDGVIGWLIQGRTWSGAKCYAG